MYRVLLMLCISFYGVYASDKKAEITLLHIKKKNNTVTCGDVSPKVYKNETYLYKVKSDVPLQNVSCQYVMHTNGIKENAFPSFQQRSNYEYICNEEQRVSNAQKKMLCKITVDCPLSSKCVKPYEIDCDLTLDIRDKEIGKIKIDEDVIRTSKAPNDEVYDAVGTYEFYDHLARISCSQGFMHQDEAGVFNLSVINKHGERTGAPALTAGKESETYIKLTADYDNAYIECDMNDYNYKKHIIIRINLIRITEPVNLGFQVNGLTLPPINKYSNVFKYPYYFGEKLIIKSFKNKQYGKMNCTGTSLPHDISGVFETTTITVDESVQNMTLQCSAQENSLGIAKNVSLQLVPTAFIDPFINGLSMPKIINIFRNGKHTLIHYEYNDEEILKLDCYSNNNIITWNYDTSEIANTTNSTSVAPLKYMSYQLHSAFKLQFNISRSKITCISMGKENYKTTVELIRKNFESFGDRKNKDLHTNKVKKEDSSDNNSGDSKGESNHFSLEIKAGIGGFICILVILLICIIVSIKKRKTETSKQKKESQNLDPTNVTYENLPELNKLPQQHPNVEGHYAAPRDNVEDQNMYMQPYFPKTIEEMYTKIIPKNKRKETYEEPAYASVDSGSTSQQVLPKGIRPGLNYIQVLPNSGSASGQALSKNGQSSDSPYAAVRFNENPYAEVGCKSENPYAEPVINNISSNEYSNVFNGQYYANNNAKSNIEPAYCEPNNVKKY